MINIQYSNRVICEEKEITKEEEEIDCGLSHDSVPYAAKKHQSTRILNTNYPILITQYPILNTPYPIPTAHHSLLNTPYSILETQYLLINIQDSRFNNQ